MSHTPSEYPTSAFDYDLPPDLVARYPSARRDESRLLRVDRASGEICDHVFRDIVELVAPGDALVVNETRVFPARLLGTRESGGAAEVFLLRPAGETGRGSGGAGEWARPAPDDALWEALVRPGSKLKPGRSVRVADELRVAIVDSRPDGTRLVRLETPLPVAAAIERHGRLPLPPYLEREAEPEDYERYQTVFARERGSVAAPTAGLHFTPAVLAALEARGVRLVRLVLHVGVGTFRPVETEDPAAHVMHAEWYDVPTAAAAALNGVRAAGGAIWAVGTTVTRTLETVADEDGCLHAGSGWTDIFIRPGYRFRAVDRLITNFHLPRSTLIMLVAAFAGYDLTMRAYEEAVRWRYRFYSYGDAMVVT